MPARCLRIFPIKRGRCNNPKVGWGKYGEGRSYSTAPVSGRGALGEVGWSDMAVNETPRLAVDQKIDRGRGHGLESFLAHPALPDLRSPLGLKQSPHRLTVRTEDSHSSNRGSIPRGGTLFGRGVEEGTEGQRDRGVNGGGMKKISFFYGLIWSELA